MAAPLKKMNFLKRCLIYRINQSVVTIPKMCSGSWTFRNRLKDVYEDGQTANDRYHGGPERHKKPHIETPKKGQYELDPPVGKVYDKLPFHTHLEANKYYFWCACGLSNAQPLCDGSHKRALQGMRKQIRDAYTPFKPHKFKVDKEGDYWLCNCKQTGNRPFCDGSHKQEDIASMRDKF